MKGHQMTSQAPPENFDVLIVGAGPTGLMLAHLLALQGIKFRIIDENSARVIESRALAIQARSMELFQNIGLVDRFLSRGTQVSGIIAYMNGKPFLGFEFSGIGRKDTPYPYLFMLSQSITEEILEESLGEFGVKVQRQTSLDRFEQRENKVIAHIKHSDGKDETVEAKYLVGCDGAKSRVRKYSGLTFEGGTYDQEFMLADAKVKWSLPYDRLQAFIGRTGLAVFFPLKGSEYSRIIIVGKNEKGTRSAEQHLTTKEPLQLEELQKKFEETIEHKVVLESPLWMTRYRVHHRSVERMQVGRIFLAGDSAHIHSPAGGQGMNTGLQDAANLAWKLALVIKGKASSDLLETYDFERMPIARKLLSFTDRIFSAG
ncbi:MAG TPA: FAD-dependent monooxygenase, partial [Bdellovibrionales bacterium]|nr:FAD-dependent monooxygenase [Bdellovibrionales bacterium]